MAEPGAGPASTTSLPQLHGFNLGPRVIAAKLAFIEKGAPYEFVERRLGEISDLRPEELIAELANAMPALIHGSLGLYELEAILRYVDEEYSGPPLQPATAAGRAIMVQMMAIMRDHLHPCAIGEIVAERIFAPLVGRRSAPEPMEAAQARLVATLKLISDISASWVARPGRDWLLGPAPSLADMQLAPILHFIRQTPEGRSAMAQCELLSAWWSRVMERTWLEAVLRSGDVG